jgi:hypothetical protein
VGDMVLLQLWWGEGDDSCVVIQSHSSQDAAVTVNASCFHSSGHRRLSCEVYRRWSREATSECVQVRKDREHRREQTGDRRMREGHDRYSESGSERAWGSMAT